MRRIGNERRLKNGMSFAKFTDEQLEQSFQGAVASERKCMDVVIRHIQEIKIRKLYLKKAFPSLFEYLVKVHKYSAGAAQRRIEAARLASEIPELSEKLVSGDINLTQIGEIQRSVKMAKKIHSQTVATSMKLELVAEACGKTTEETQRLCAEKLDLPVIEHERIQSQADGSQRIEMTFSQELKEKYELVKGLLAHRNFQAGRTTEMADILETCFDFILAQLGPEPTPKKRVSVTIKEEQFQAAQSVSAAEKDWQSQTAAIRPGVERRTQGSSDKVISGAETNGLDQSLRPIAQTEVFLSRQAISMTETSRSRQSISITETSRPSPAWKSLTPKRRKFILSRDQSCQHRDPLTGRVCGSRFQLELDHRHPRFAGGAHDPDNLRVLCRKHNLYRYQNSC